jgi:NAD+ diphosphatase
MQQTHPFNVFRYCPKCSSSRFEISGKRSLKCSDCGLQYFINSTAAVAALVADGNGCLLLTTRGVEPHYGMLDLPGGFIDPGETAEEAVVRELHEELGLKVKETIYAGSSTNEYVYAGLSVFTLDLAFRVIPESVAGLKAMDDILDYRFYAYDEIDFKQIPAPSIRKFVNQFFRK